MRQTKLHTVLPLNFQVKIFSGISPPIALPNSMASGLTAAIYPTTLGPVHETAYPPLSGDVGASGTDYAPRSYGDAIADDPNSDYSGVRDVNVPEPEKNGTKLEDLKGDPALPPVYEQGQAPGGEKEVRWVERVLFYEFEWERGCEERSDSAEEFPCPGYIQVQRKTIKLFLGFLRVLSYGSKPYSKVQFHRAERRLSISTRHEARLENESGTRY
jgi:hypothetical protein